MSNGEQLSGLHCVCLVLCVWFAYFIYYHLLSGEVVVFGWEIFLHQFLSSPIGGLALQPDRECFCLTQ